MDGPTDEPGLRLGPLGETSANARRDAHGWSVSRGWGGGSAADPRPHPAWHRVGGAPRPSSAAPRVVAVSSVVGSNLSRSRGCHLPRDPVLVKETWGVRVVDTHQPAGRSA